MCSFGALGFLAAARQAAESDYAGDHGNDRGAAAAAEDKELRRLRGGKHGQQAPRGGIFGGMYERRIHAFGSGK